MATSSLATSEGRKLGYAPIGVLRTPVLETWLPHIIPCKGGKYALERA